MINTEILTLVDIVGQERAKKKLELFGMTLAREGKMPNLGVWGHAGQGKTTLIRAWCNDHGIEMFYINGPGLRDILSIREFFEKAREKSGTKFVIFIDECHGIKKDIQTAMLTMMEAPFILVCTAPREVSGVVTPEGITRFVSKGDILREQVPKNLSFAIASTNKEKIINTMLSRVRHIDLEDYSIDEVAEIARRHLRSTPSDHLLGLAMRSRSIRHLIEELIATYKDIISAYGSADLNKLDDILGIDKDGATNEDRLYLQYINKHGTVGLDNLAAFFQKDRKEIQERVEPFLLSRGWITTTKLGRALTDTGRRKMGILI